MMETPELSVNDLAILRPVNRRILPEVTEAYMEDPVAAKAALPWLKEGEEARGQIADLMIDLEMHRNGDKIHFWAIHSTNDNSFIGMIGLGDELQPRHLLTIWDTGFVKNGEAWVLHLHALMRYLRGKEIELNNL